MADVDAGDVIAPLREVLKRLSGRIDEDTAEDLVLAFTGYRRELVQPGDLITARLINQVLVDLGDLRRRVGALEDRDGQLTLLRIEPEGDLAIGSLATVVGTGFAPRAPDDVSVMVGGERITRFFLGSTEGRLSFQLPDLFAGLPRTVQVAVQVGTRVSNSLPLNLLPRVPVPQGGKVEIVSTTPPLPSITVDGIYELTWLVDSQTVYPADYTFELRVTDVQGSPITATLEEDRQTIARGRPFTVRAAITVPAGAQRANVSLAVASVDGSIPPKTSGPVEFVVGEAPEISDPRLLIQTPVYGPASRVRSAQLIVDGRPVSGIEVPFNEETPVQFNLVATGAAPTNARYALTAEFAEGDHLPVKPGSRGIEPGVTQTVTVSVRADAIEPRMLTVRASKQGADSFTSFLRIPVRGYQ